MRKIISFVSRHYLLLITCTAACLYILGNGQKNFGLDEISSIIFTRDWSTLLHIIKYFEGNMWLYYIILFFWSKISMSEIWLRSLSAIFATISVPFFYHLTKKLTKESVAKVATLFFVCNIFVIQNAQNVRSYSLLLLLTTMSCYYFVSYVLKRSNLSLFAYMTLNIMAVYTHLYAVFIIAIQFLSLLLFVSRVQWKKVIIIFLSSSIFLLPYLLAPSLHSGQIDWISKPDLRQVIKTYIILANDFLPLNVIFSGLFVSYFYSLWKIRKQFTQTIQIWKYEFVYSWLIFPIIAAFIISYILKPMYLPMYFIISVAPFTILSALALTHIQSNTIKKIVLISIILLSALRLYGWYTQNSHFNAVFFNNNEDWTKVDVFLSQNGKSGDAVLSFPSFVLDYSEFYAQKDHISLINLHKVALLPNRVLTGKASGNFDTALLNKIPQEYPTVWFIYGDYLDPKIEYQHTLIESMLYKNYILKGKYTFSILTVYKYERK